jgi:hypothetical protein
MRRLWLSVIGTALLATAGVYAHHSYADFLVDQPVSIEGDLVDVLYANPHVMLKLKAGDSRTYTAEWRAWSQLSRRGMTERVLNPGDHLIVTASPARNPDVYRLALIREIRRPADGWSWVRTVPSASSQDR